MNLPISQPYMNITNRLFWWTILLLLLFLIFSVAAGQTFAILLIVIWITKSIQEKSLGINKNPIILPFLVFVFSRILAVAFSEYPQLSIQSLNKEIFFYVVFFALISFPSLVKKENLKMIIRILILTALVASLTGSVKVLAGIEERASSTTSGYYTLGMYLTVIFAMVLVIKNNNELIFSGRIWSLVIIILLIGILFTQNRIHWIITGLFIAAIGITRERILLGISVIIFIAAIFLFPSLMERLSQLINFTHNFSDRDIIWKGALQIYDYHPLLGFGTRTFREIFPLFNELTDKGVGGWHCDYLQVYIEGGIIGLLAFLWLVGTIFYLGIKNILRLKADKFYYDVSLSVVAGLLVLFSTALVGGFFLDPISSLLFQVLLAVQTLLMHINISEQKHLNDNL